MGAFLASLAWFWPAPCSNSHGVAAGGRGEWGSAEGRSKERFDSRSRFIKKSPIEYPPQTKSTHTKGTATAHKTRLLSRKQAGCSIDQGKFSKSRVRDGQEKHFEVRRPAAVACVGRCLTGQVAGKAARYEPHLERRQKRGFVSPFS